MLADKILAGKSKLEDYFPDYAQYTQPVDGKELVNTGGVQRRRWSVYVNQSYLFMCLGENVFGWWCLLKDVILSSLVCII